MYVSIDDGGAMTEKLIYISYKRAGDTAHIAEMLDKKIRVNLTTAGFKSWCDQRAMEAGNAWCDDMDVALAQASHFIALLSDEYWSSEQCQKELLGAVERCQREGLPKLLFIPTDKIQPGALEISPDGKIGRLNRPFPQVNGLEQINLLGPHDEAGHLLPLECASGAPLLAGQLYALVHGFAVDPGEAREVMAE